MLFIDFFAGIGGISLGLERAGHICVGHVEKNVFCRGVLRKHWPSVFCANDIAEVELLPKSDLWAAGFPCQDISSAGEGVGIHGKRSGLFFEFMRLVRIYRPKIILLENVAALLVRGLGEVLLSLSSCGYDAEWGTLFAASFGAPHLRERVFVVAYPAGQRQQGPWVFGENAGGNTKSREWETTDAIDAIRRGDVPALCGSPHGISDRMDRNGALGNAVVPDCAEWIGRKLHMMGGAE